MLHEILLNELNCFHMNIKFAKSRVLVSGFEIWQFIHLPYGLMGWDEQASGLCKSIYEANFKNWIQYF